MIEDRNPLEQIRKRIEAGDASSAIEQLRALVSGVHRLLAMAYLKDDAFGAAIAALEEARASIRHRRPRSHSATF
jgi:capsule polysaccharide export protein KpsE/RkpR